MFDPMRFLMLWFVIYIKLPKVINETTFYEEENNKPKQRYKSSQYESNNEGMYLVGLELVCHLLDYKHHKMSLVRL